MKIERDKPWKDDPRFMVRPEVCGHCYMLNELILDNANPIILDEKNNVFHGPNGYFKIVVDDFDGEKINAWHIEDRTGMKTRQPGRISSKQSGCDGRSEWHYRDLSPQDAAESIGISRSLEIEVEAGSKSIGSVRGRELSRPNSDTDSDSDREEIVMGNEVAASDDVNRRARSACGAPCRLSGRVCPGILALIVIAIFCGVPGIPFPLYH